MGIDIFEALQMLECGPQFGKPESHLTCQISPSFVLLFHHWYPSCCLPSWQMWWLNDSFYIQIAYAADVFMWITTKVQYVWLENLRTGLLFPTMESPEHASLYAPLQKRNRNLADHNRPRLLLNFSELSTVHKLQLTSNQFPENPIFTTCTCCGTEHQEFPLNRVFWNFDFVTGSAVFQILEFNNLSSLKKGAFRNKISTDIGRASKMT